MATQHAQRHLTKDPNHSERKIGQSIWRGARRTCPSCGHGLLFKRYLKVADRCQFCSEALYHHRADDAPPYFAILLIGHLILALVLLVEVHYRPALWLHALLWLPLTLVLVLAILPPIKGALVALQWALYMHGFDPSDQNDERSHIDHSITIARKKNG